MNNIIVNSSNLADTVNVVIEQIKTLNDTQAKKAELPELIRTQKEKLFNTVQQLLSFAVSVNNDTPLTQIAPLFKSYKECQEILKFFKFAVRRTKGGELKRAEYAKKDAKSAADAVLNEQNPFSLEFIEQQKLAKRQAKENAAASTKYNTFKNQLLKLRKEAEKNGLSTYSDQLNALIALCEIDIKQNEEQETKELLEMPSLAVKAA